MRRGKHLSRPTGAPRSLSRETGLERLAMDEHVLPEGRRIALRGAMAAEGFVYVVSGAGRLATQSGSLDIASGDFIVLDVGESAELENPHARPLIVLAGFCAVEQRR